LRHSERIDKVDDLSGQVQKDWIPCDPFITENGKKIAFEAGRKIHQYIIERQDKGRFKDCEMQMVVSPFIRTLQTASYFK
jgi:hypothetical protein